MASVIIFLSDTALHEAVKERIRRAGKQEVVSKIVPLFATFNQESGFDVACDVNPLTPYAG